MRRFDLYIILVLGWGSYCHSQVIHIPGDQPTIQAGIDTAMDGDTVLINEGTYFENINFLGKAITVASRYLIDGDTSHITRTIINGSKPANQDTASVVTLWSGEDTTSILCGLTITGGSGTFVNHIHSEQFLSPNISYYAGGGILVYNSGGKIIHNIIKANQMPVPRERGRGSAGCGILAAVNRNHTVIIRNNIIRNNSSGMKGAWGGGICIYGGKALIEQNYIVANLIDVQGIAAGAGIFTENERREGTIEEVIIRNNVITENQGRSTEVVSAGGGIALSMGFDSARVLVEHNMIANNSAGDIGGGIYGWASRAEISGNLVFNNQAGLYGTNIGTEAENDIDMRSNMIWSGENWIASHLGVFLINPGKGSIEGFLPPEGLPIRSGQAEFSIDPATGEIHIGSKRNMISLDPDSLSMNTFLAPSVFLTYQTFTGKNGTIQRSRLYMPVGGMAWNLWFGLFDVGTPPDTRYSYYIKGIDRDTVEMVKAQNGKILDLKPGRYAFWSSRIEQNGVTGQEGINFDIRVRAPWYRSTWSLVVFLTISTLFVIGVIRIRTARLQREKSKLEEEVKNRTIELQQKNEQIRGMEQLKTRFFTDISHEIRTPLSLIKAPLDLLIRKEYGDAKSREWLNMIRGNTNRLLQLVNQLLDISRLDEGQLKLVLERSDLLKHLRMVTEEFRSMADKREIRFITDLPEGELINWYDRDKTTKIITNLLSNAFKFTPDRGTVTCRIKVNKIRCDHSPVMLRITVADTGTGITKADHDKIFTRFFRSENPGYEESGGTGIGLALTRELVRKMHGEITFKSLVGRGTLFLVSIPLGTDHLSAQEYILKEPARRDKMKEAAVPAAGTIPREAEFADGSIRLLIVEDSEELRTFIREELSDNYLVMEAEDGIRGLELAHSEIPDLVISDIMMPGMDGLEFCRRLKRDERTSHIPVIMLTARSTPNDKVEGLQVGADAYIFKPFELEVLRVRIRNLLEQRERLRRKYSTLIGMDLAGLPVTTLDEKFLKKAIGIISENISEIEFNVSTLQEQMFLSRVHLFRKIKALTGKSPSELIREYRIATAAAMIEKREDKITDVALNVGFANPSYFTKCFKEQFGITPRQYRIAQK